jgi:hypothetical protein
VAGLYQSADWFLSRVEKHGASDFPPLNFAERQEISFDQLFESTKPLEYCDTTKPVILSPFLRYKTPFSA